MSSPGGSSVRCAIAHRDAAYDSQHRTYKRAVGRAALAAAVAVALGTSARQAGQDADIAAAVREGRTLAAAAVAAVVACLVPAPRAVIVGVRGVNGQQRTATSAILTRRHRLVAAPAVAAAAVAAAAAAAVAAVDVGAAVAMVQASGTTGRMIDSLIVTRILHARKARLSHCTACRGRGGCE